MRTLFATIVFCGFIPVALHAQTRDTATQKLYIQCGADLAFFSDVLKQADDTRNAKNYEIASTLFVMKAKKLMSGDRVDAGIKTIKDRYETKLDEQLKRNDSAAIAASARRLKSDIDKNCDRIAGELMKEFQGSLSPK